MEDWVREIVDEERKKRNIPLEAKLLNGNYYLYRSTSRYDRAGRKAVKVSEYIGRITRAGVSEKARETRSIYEYGNSALLYSLSADLIARLQKHFPDRWQDLYALSMVRLMEPVPLKSVKDRWEKLYVSREMEAHLSPNTLTGILRDTGSDEGAQMDLFQSLITESKKLAFDLSSIFSRSENLNMAAKGHNADHIYLPQINMALAFDLDQYRPVFLKSLEGSVRDVKSLRKVLEEIQFDGILVLDTGFSSQDLAEIMSSEMKFIMPLRRNQEMIDYTMEMRSSFVYRDRGIRSGFLNRDSYRIYMFQDQMLMAEESSTFIKMIAEKKRTQKEFDSESIRFGKISILSNVRDDPETIYNLYKQREEIEQAFDAMKNELENDKAYLGDDDSLRGYFFVSFLSLYLYYSVFMLIRAADLTGKLSVKDVLLKFSKVYRIVRGNRETLSEIPSSVEKIDSSLGTNIFPKKLRS
ncbi:Transposase [Thermoplasmatales archaeon]|nr:Transposase [Thermoplasmatales archaeon]